MATYAVFANGTFMGVFDGADEAQAIQAAADEHGTEGDTSGLTVKPLGAYVLEVKDGCDSNEVNINDLVREFFNCAEASVDDEGDIWIADPQTGHWIDSEKKAGFLAWVEA